MYSKTQWNLIVHAAVSAHTRTREPHRTCARVLLMLRTCVCASAEVHFHFNIFLRPSRHWLLFWLCEKWRGNHIRTEAEARCCNYRNECRNCDCTRRFCVSISGCLFCQLQSLRRWVNISLFCLVKLRSHPALDGAQASCISMIVFNLLADCIAFCAVPALLGINTRMQGWQGAVRLCNGSNGAWGVLRNTKIPWALHRRDSFQRCPKVGELSFDIIVYSNGMRWCLCTLHPLFADWWVTYILIGIANNPTTEFSLWAFFSGAMKRRHELMLPWLLIHAMSSFVLVAGGISIYYSEQFPRFFNVYSKSNCRGFSFLFCFVFFLCCSIDIYYTNTHTYCVNVIVWIFNLQLLA